jgi:hypothetical protein
MNTERHLVTTVDRQLRELRAKDRQLSAPTLRVGRLPFLPSSGEASEEERKEFAILFDVLVDRYSWR